MTNRLRRYFSRKTQVHRVRQLVSQVQNHPNGKEILDLLQDQVSDDTYRVRPQVFAR
jgi:hypothetical protein